MKKRFTSKASDVLFMGRCGVFIDAANLSSSARKFGLSVDYKKLAKFFHSLSSQTFLRYYGVTFDTKRQQPFFGMLNARGYRIITKPIKTIHDYIEKKEVRKANFDVEIAVDAVRLIKNFDVFVLFSGDSDFTYLCTYMKKAKKTIVVFSTRWRVAKELIQVADYYVDIKKYKTQFMRKEP